MKKVLILLLVGFALFAAPKAEAQILKQDTYSYFWGTAADTLIQSDTISLAVRVTGSDVLDINFGLAVTKVSGTVTSNFIFAGSMDNVSFVDLDTIALSNASSGMNYVRLENFNYPYLRVRSITDSTPQKASYKLWYIARKD